MTIPDYEIKLLFIDELLDATVRGCRFDWGRGAFIAVILVESLEVTDFMSLLGELFCFYEEDLSLLKFIITL